jgi:hypothetical protein
MSASEQWAADQGRAPVAPATERAAPFYFYRALAYQESVIYHHKMLDGQATEQPGMPCE